MKNVPIIAADNKKLAFFDLDYTITTQDTGFLFIKSWIKRHPLYSWRIIVAPILLILWKTKLVPLSKLKEFFFGFIKGKTVKEIDNLAKKYINNRIDSILKPGALDKIQELLDLDYTVILASASPEFYVKHIAKKLNIIYYFATSYTTLNNYYTGKIEGNDCRGKEKIKKIEKKIKLKNYNYKKSYSFSDSKADIPLLSLAGNAFYVNKKKWKLKTFYNIKQP